MRSPGDNANHPGWSNEHDMPRGKNKVGMPDRRPAPPNYRIQRYFTLGQLLIVVLDRKSAAMTKWLILGNLWISEQSWLSGR